MLLSNSCASPSLDPGRGFQGAGGESKSVAEVDLLLDTSKDTPPLQSLVARKGQMAGG